MLSSTNGEKVATVEMSPEIIKNYKNIKIIKPPKLGYFIIVEWGAIS